MESQLPGRENGPADAYRHVLWSGELTRRFGERTARAILEFHELQGDASGLLGRDAQSPEAAAMDRHNNEIGVAIGRRAATWDDVRQAAQEVMDESDRSGDGRNGGAVWLPETAWRNNPKDRQTGIELPSSRWNWPDTDWIEKRVPTPGALPYPYGGPAFGYDAQVDEDDPERRFASPAAAIAPLSRPVASWSADDLREIMASPAFLQRGHAGRQRAVAMVRLWFEERFPGPMQADATGRGRPARDRATRSGACEVPVRAHARSGGEVEVDAHCRAKPAA